MVGKAEQCEVLPVCHPALKASMQCEHERAMSLPDFPHPYRAHNKFAPCRRLAPVGEASAQHSKKLLSLF